jgi:hypothetical protein
MDRVSPDVSARFHSRELITSVSAMMRINDVTGLVIVVVFMTVGSRH